MENHNEKSKIIKQTKTSKDLLYPEYVDSTIVEHVLKSLEKTSNFSRKEEMNKFFETKKKSGALEKAKELISMLNGQHEGSCLEASADDKEAIEVELTIGAEASDDDIDECRADAFFMLPRVQCQNSNSSEDVCSKMNSYISSPKEVSMLDFDDSSSNSSNDASLQNFFVTKERKNNLIEVMKESSPPKDLHNDEPELNLSELTGKRKFCNNIQNNYSGVSADESSDGEHFLVSTKKKKMCNISESYFSEEERASSPALTPKKMSSNSAIEKEKRLLKTSEQNK